MSVRCLSLDFDDTLVESEAMKRRVLEAVAAAAGASASAGRSWGAPASAIRGRASGGWWA